MKGNSSSKAWLISSAVIGIVLIFVGLFFYNNFFRQTNAPLIETVPAEAAFVFEINDNEQFVKSSASLMTYLTDLFAIDGLAGFESFLEKMPKKDGQILVAGFVEDDKLVPLFSTRMDQHYFKNLLKVLQIDPRNNIKFEEYEIYSYGTHYKDFKFVFHNGVFSVSEDIELLKKTIVQLKYPKGLTNMKSFKELHELVDKNVKQNWLLINPQEYVNYLKTKTGEQYVDFWDSYAGVAEWCAYQVRFSDVEMFLSGYAYTENPMVQKFAEGNAPAEFPQRVVPITANAITVIDDENHQQLFKYFKQNQSIATKEQLDDFERIAPVQSVFFSLSTDTLSYRYCVLKLDTTCASYVSFFADSLAADSVLRNSQNGIYSCDAISLAPLFSSIGNGNDYHCFMQVRDCYVLADTVAALEHYKAIAKNTNYIESGNSFRFAASNTPSDAVCNFLFFNHDEVLKKYMEPTFAKKSKMNDLKVFSFSLAVPTQKMVSSNIYLKF